MPGSNLNLDLPSLSDTFTTIVSKTITALGAIQDDLAPKITPGVININASLVFNGNAATSLGSIQLASGNTPTVAGSIYYSGGEFYAIDATGTVQLTSNGAINAAGFGAIVGDYGGTDPARVTYVLASGTYQFFISAGVWADIAAAHLVLEGSAGTVTLGVDAALTGPRQVNFKSLPTSGTSLLVYNSATSTIEDSAVTAVTNALAGPLTMPGITTTADQKHTDQWRLDLNLAPAQTLISATASPRGVTSTGATWQYDGPTLPLRQGDRVKLYSFYATTKTGDITLYLAKYSPATGVTTTVDSFTFSGAGGTPLFERNVPAGSQAPVLAAEVWFLSMTGTTSGDIITGMHILFDHP